MTAARPTRKPQVAWFTQGPAHLRWDDPRLHDNESRAVHDRQPSPARQRIRESPPEPEEEPIDWNFDG